MSEHGRDEGGERELTRDEKLTLPYRGQVKSLNASLHDLEAERERFQEVIARVIDHWECNTETGAPQWLFDAQSEGK
jgi:hypothetical protein